MFLFGMAMPEMEKIDLTPWNKLFSCFWPFGTLIRGKTPHLRMFWHLHSGRQIHFISDFSMFLLGMAMPEVEKNRFEALESIIFMFLAIGDPHKGKKPPLKDVLAPRSRQIDFISGFSMFLLGMAMPEVEKK
jgi:hypothetical protein